MLLKKESGILTNDVRGPAPGDDVPGASMTFKGQSFVLVMLCLVMFLFSGCKLKDNPEDVTQQIRKYLERVFLSEIRLPAWAIGSGARICYDRGTERLYIPQGYPGLAVYDITDPSSPQPVVQLHSKEFPGQYQPGAVAARGGRVFVALKTPGNIVELDFSTPTAPVFKNTFGSIPDIRKMSLQGNLLYVFGYSSFEYDGGVYVFDISGESPALVGQYLTDLIDPGFYMGPNGTAFIARTPAWLGEPAMVDVVDLSWPAEPRLFDTWESEYPGNITDIYLEDGLLYLSAYWGGIWVVDVSDYGNMTLAGRLDWGVGDRTAVSICALPPYVIIAGGGNLEGSREFVIFHHQDNVFKEKEALPAEASPDSVIRVGDLLFTVQLNDPYGSNPEKIIHLHRIRKRQEHIRP